VTAMPQGFTPVVAFDACFDAVYGLEVVSEDVEGEGVLRGRVPVRAELHTAHGSVHGGVFAAVAEALASRGTALSVMPRGSAAMGLSNDTTILRPVHDGVIDVAARLLSRAEQEWLWTVEARDAAGRPCAFSRITVAVRPMRADA
jgi:1,4-dihydroxy-2-naphthoyl-CoA hydrolase